MRLLRTMWTGLRHWKQWRMPGWCCYQVCALKTETCWWPHVGAYLGEELNALGTQDTCTYVILYLQTSTEIRLSQDNKTAAQLQEEVTLNSAISVWPNTCACLCSSLLHQWTLLITGKSTVTCNVSSLSIVIGEIPATVHSNASWMRQHR